MSDSYGGNGGLSLRRLSRIIQVLETQERNPNTELEDLWLVQRLGHLPGANMANTTVEASFSVENVFVDEPLGYHTGWSGARFPEGVWGTKEHRAHIWKYCPEIKMVLDMKLSVKCDEKDKRDNERRSIDGDDDIMSGVMPW